MKKIAVFLLTVFTTSFIFPSVLLILSYISFSKEVNASIYYPQTKDFFVSHIAQYFDDFSDLNIDSSIFERIVSNNFTESSFADGFSQFKSNLTNNDLGFLVFRIDYSSFFQNGFSTLFTDLGVYYFTVQKKCEKGIESLPANLSCVPVEMSVDNFNAYFSDVLERTLFTSLSNEIILPLEIQKDVFEMNSEFEEVLINFSVIALFSFLIILFLSYSYIWDSLAVFSVFIGINALFLVFIAILTSKFSEIFPVENLDKLNLLIIDSFFITISRISYNLFVLAIPSFVFALICYLFIRYRKKSSNLITI